MNLDNPYKSPADSRALALSSETVVQGTVESRFTFTPEHLVATLSKYREQHTGRRIWRWIRYVIAFLFLSIAVLSLWIGLYWAIALFGILAVLMYIPHKLDDYLAIRNFRTSPHCDIEQTICLSDAGFVAQTDLETTELKWPVFTKATFFPDGVLLFRGPKVIHWIPDSTLEDTDAALMLRKLVSSKVAVRHFGPGF